MKEPAWANMGYHSNKAYGAECNICDTTVELEFAEDRSNLLSFKHKDNVDQDYLFAFVFYGVLIKLERECDCTEEERESFKEVTFSNDGTQSLNTLSA